MDYIFLIYSEESAITAMSQEELRIAIGKHGDLHRDTRAKGILRGSGRLEPAISAKTFVTQNGRTTATDGPFAETKEVLGGYYLIDCASESEASAWATRIAETRPGTRIEMRPMRPPMFPE